MKITDYDKYPPGHPLYVPPLEQQLHQPRQHTSGGGYTKHSRLNSASPQRSTKPWELQTIKRSDGSIILQEVFGDLFMAPDTYSLVNCVGADFHMGKGIDVQFKKRFGGVGELLSFNAHVGGLAYLVRRGRFIYYLVTKAQYNKKPAMKTLEASLRHLYNHCKANNVTNIAMPTIGCGLDKLDWYEVRDLLVEVFRPSQVKISVYMA